MDKGIFEKLPTLEIDQDALQEFKEIYQAEFGKTLSDAEALEMGQRLLRLFQIIYRPIPGDPDCIVDQFDPDIDSS